MSQQESDKEVTATLIYHNLLPPTHSPLSLTLQSVAAHILNYSRNAFYTLTHTWQQAWDGSAAHALISKWHIPTRTRDSLEMNTKMKVAAFGPQNPCFPNECVKRPVNGAFPIPSHSQEHLEGVRPPCSLQNLCLEMSTCKI